MIPHIIHQIWIGPKTAPTGLIDTWRKLNPTFEHVLWDEAKCYGFRFRNQQQIQEAPELAGKCDLMRYEILARHGGIYVDADSTCIRPLDDHLLGHEAWTTYEDEISKPGALANGFMGSIPESRAMRTLVAACSGMTGLESLPAWQTTGPVLVTELVKAHPGILHVYPSWWFNWNLRRGAYEGPGVVYAHHYGGSSFDLYERFAGLHQ